MPTKRKYSLSDAALKQRQVASAHAREKRTKATIEAKFPKLSTDAPMKDHLARAAHIKAYKQSVGLLPDSAKGGRPSKLTKCERCGEEMTASEAWRHCRTPKPRVAKESKA